jgi:50S ribosomal subunit-associated GTPase HflX
LFHDFAYFGWPIAIVGNKADQVKEGEELEQKAQMFAKEKDYAHYRVSAKTWEGIDTLFQEFTALVVRTTHPVGGVESGTSIAGHPIVAERSKC